MIHSNCMLLTLGLFIFCFQDACSIGLYPDKCHYVPKIGYCLYPTPVARYFFEPVRGHCMMFTYSGCMGNANNFLTLPECERECAIYGEPQPICYLPKEVGRCTDSLSRYYYNTGTAECEEFTYTGCTGNKNNFETWFECRHACQNSNHLPEKCQSGPSLGYCYTPLEIRYFFDGFTGTCMRFSYSGCGGNENNFLTEEECLKECKRPKIERPWGRR